MQTHNFEENVKVDIFCLRLLGEARLWYETLNLDAIDWPALQNAFRQQYSKLVKQLPRTILPPMEKLLF